MSTNVPTYICTYIKYVGMCIYIYVVTGVYEISVYYIYIYIYIYLYTHYIYRSLRPCKNACMALCIYTDVCMHLSGVCAPGF